MSGTLAYEIRGLKEDGPNVYHAAYEIGKPMGLKSLVVRLVAGIVSSGADR